MVLLTCACSPRLGVPVSPMDWSGESLPLSHDGGTQLKAVESTHPLRKCFHGFS